MQKRFQRILDIARRLVDTFVVFCQGYEWRKIACSKIEGGVLDTRWQQSWQ
jgi:hypothetical protein